MLFSFSVASLLLEPAIVFSCTVCAFMLCKPAEVSLLFWLARISAAVFWSDELCWFDACSMLSWLLLTDCGYDLPPLVCLELLD